MLDDLIAVCGVSCTQCQSYQATRNQDREALEKIAAEWTQGLHKTYRVEDIMCDGCRAGGRLSAYCAECDILACARSAGHLTCAHCPQVPCEKIQAPPAREALLKLRRELGLA